LAESDLGDVTQTNATLIGADTLLSAARKTDLQKKEA
jgi:hypothetical protein